MQVQSYKAGSTGTVEIDARPFGDKVLYRTLKDAVVMHLANQRQGNASTKGRSEVRGTNKKPYKQKHTGRARAGDVKSPIWRGGGTVFGPKPRDFSYHMPKKARRLALRTAIAGKLADNEVVIADLGTFAAPSARSARKLLADLGTPRRTLLVVNEREENTWKSFRNFAGLSMRTADELCAWDVAYCTVMVAEGAAMDSLAQRVGAPETAGDTETGGEA
ncbi:MAG: 50S ribosomal protein L4 [Planctomycetota bacterium]|jgi:large subunit ribosomal protein L4|nr:50S ribosomal protein L4 [Planctomycetota bacterium]MDP6520898.1 50S ribosomal protein L4 [Planctomycetota bacterium]MDP6956578.1 50S ribosomal protein L4 [Planctomycetota bacterium]